MNHREGKGLVGRRDAAVQEAGRWNPYGHDASQVVDGGARGLFRLQGRVRGAGFLMLSDSRG
jgi:hypothetical protein